jgi:hypothetical protein
LSGLLDQSKDRTLNYERDSVVNTQGFREWDFVVGAKSPKGKSLGNGGSGIKGMMQSKLPKLKKKVVAEKEE